MMDPFNAAYDQRPTDSRCEREIEISVVGDRCVYVNNHRVAGGKPYISENLPSRLKKTTVRQVLDSFTPDEIEAYLREKQSREAYLMGVRAYRDASVEQSA